MTVVAVSRKPEARDGRERVEARLQASGCLSVPFAKRSLRADQTVVRQGAHRVVVCVDAIIVKVPLLDPLNFPSFA